jgi:hypothetical protein
MIDLRNMQGRPKAEKASQGSQMAQLGRSSRWRTSPVAGVMRLSPFHEVREQLTRDSPQITADKFGKVLDASTANFEERRGVWFGKYGQLHMPLCGLCPCLESPAERLECPSNKPRKDTPAAGAHLIGGRWA